MKVSSNWFGLITPMRRALVLVLLGCLTTVNAATTTSSLVPKGKNERFGLAFGEHNNLNDAIRNKIREAALVAFDTAKKNNNDRNLQGDEFVCDICPGESIANPDNEVSLFGFETTCGEAADFITRTAPLVGMTAFQVCPLVVPQIAPFSCCGTTAATVVETTPEPTTEPTPPPTRAPTPEPTTPEPQPTRRPTTLATVIPQPTLEPTVPGPDAFRDVFSQAAFNLASFYTMINVGLFNVRLDFDNVQCRDIVFDDIEVNYYRANYREIVLGINVLELDINCYMDLSYDMGLVSGGGQMVVTSTNNLIGTEIEVRSRNFARFPPRSARAGDCTAEITIDDIELSGGGILNMFDASGLDANEMFGSEVSSMLCAELGSLDYFVEALIDTLSGVLEPYTGPMEAWRLDPLVAERDLHNGTGTRGIVSFNEEEGQGKIVTDLMQQVNNYFTGESTNPATGSRELGVNGFLRDNLLGPGGSFAFEMEDLSSIFSPLLIDLHDGLTDTRLEINDIAIAGLDSLTRFDPIQNIGNQTYRFNMSWETLTLDVDATIDFAASTLRDALMESTAPPVNENFKISFGLDDIDFVVDMFFAVDENAFRKLQIGPLLFSENITSCILSVMHNVSITGLNPSIQNIRNPITSNFRSRSLDELVASFGSASLAMYEDVFLNAIPVLFQTTIRDFMNEGFANIENAGDYCRPVEVSAEDEFLDFRDLLLGSEQAIAMGGNGDRRYGDIAGVLYSFLQGMVTAEDDDGTLRINDQFIRPFTSSQSGVDGMFRYAEDLVSLGGNDVDDGGLLGFIETLRLTDARIQNLDTLVPPMEFLEPKEGDPYVLSNRVQMGPVAERPLTASLAMVLQFLGQDSEGEIDVTFSARSVDLLADLYVEIEAAAFLRFPLEDVFNLNCWLALLPPGISFSSFSTIMPSLAPSLRCSGGTCAEERSLLPDLNVVLEQTIQASGILGERIAPLLEGVATGFIDQLILDAPRYCPHSPQYEGTAMNMFQLEGLTGLKLPGLDATAIDTIAFGAGTAAHVGMVLLSDLYGADDIGSAQAFPLSKQNEFMPPDEIQERLLDWTNLDDSGSPMLVMGVDLMRSVVESLVNNERGRRNLQFLDYLFDLFDMFGGLGDLSSMVGGAGDMLGLDGLLDNFIGEDGTFTLTLEDIEFEMAGFGFGITSLRLGGLDSFTRFELFDAIGPQTLMNTFDMERLSLQVTLQAYSLVMSEPPREFSLSMDMNDVSVIAPLFAALDLESFNSMGVGNLLVFNDILPCLVSTMYETEILQLFLTVGDVTNLRFDGLMDDTERVMSDLSDAILGEGFRDSIIRSVSLIANNVVRPVANRFLADYVSGSACKNVMADRIADGGEDTYVDFRDMLLSEEDAVAYGGSGGSPYGDLFRFAYDTVKSVMEVNPDTGLVAINAAVIGPLTRDQSGEAGTLSFAGDLFRERISLRVDGFTGNVGLAISDVRVESLDTMGQPFSLLDVVMQRPHLLNNTASMGVGGTPVRLSARLLLEIQEEDGINSRNDVTVSLDFHAATLVLTGLIQVAENRLATFPVRDLLNMECWFATIPVPRLNRRGQRLYRQNSTAGIERLAASLAQLSLQVDCNSCTSPGLEQWAETLSTREAIDDLTATGNDIIGFLTDIGEGDFVQMMIDRRLNEAELKCPHNPRYDPSGRDVNYRSFPSTQVEHSSSLIFMIVIILICLLVVMSIVGFVVQRIVRRRHRNWLATLSKPRMDRVVQQQKRDDLLESDLNKSTLSMFRSTDIPALVRYTMPLIILGNIAFFLSGHLSLGATVTVIGEIAGEELVVDNFFEFAIAQSTIDLWNAGGRIVAVFLMIFSIVWPYTKQLITLFLWFLGPGACSVSRRGSILLWLDFLAKWSMVDVFTLVLTIAAMRIQIVSPDLGFLPEDFYSITMLVVPRWGLYANMTAQLISQISSHFIIHYHRKIIQGATIRHEEQQISEHLSTSGTNPYPFTTKAAIEDERKEALHRHAFARPHRGESEKVVARPYVNSLLCVAAVALCILLIVGCVTPSFSLEQFGIVAFIQNFGPSQSDQSVFSVVGMMMDQARLLDTPNDRIGMGTLSGLVILSVLIVPLMQTVVLLYQWFIPMSKKTRMNMSVITEILAAWQYAEVYILSALFSSWQLAPTSTFLFNPYCWDIRGDFAMLEHFDILDENNAQCFQVLASVENATYYIIAGAALLIFLNSFIMKATTQYFRDTVKNDNTEPTTKPSEGEQLGGDSSVSERETKIHPVPVLFSDAYRWMLVRKEVVIGIDELDREEPVKTYDLGENSFDAAKSYNAAIESNPKQANTSDLQGNDGPLAMQQAETAATYDNESNSSVDNKERAMMQKQESTEGSDLESNPYYDDHSLESKERAKTEEPFHG